MKTEDRPEKIMAMTMLLRVSAGKFFMTLTEDQSSTTREQTKRTGMVSRLL